MPIGVFAVRERKEMEFTFINQGRTAEVYDMGNGRILKLFRKGYPVYDVENELNIASHIKDCQLPIPQFFGKVEEDGRIGLVYENIKGLPMLRMFMVNPSEFFKYAKDMAEIHALIHKTKVDGIPLQKEHLEYSIRMGNELPDSIKEMIIGQLKQLNDGNSLCHGDLHPDNILYSVDGKPFVIDWMTATTGNPAGDVARTIVVLKFSGVPSHHPFVTRVILNSMKSIFCNAYRKHYIRVTGMDIREIRAWELPVAAGRLVENGPPEEIKALKKFIFKELKSRRNIRPTKSSR